MNKLNIPDGEYEVSYSSEFDRGYGIESASDEVVLEFKNGELIAAWTSGIHFITEDDIQWDVEITDEEAINLVTNLLTKKGA